MFDSIRDNSDAIPGVIVFTLVVVYGVLMFLLPVFVCFIWLQLGDIKKLLKANIRLSHPDAVVGPRSWEVRGTHSMSGKETTLAITAESEEDAVGQANDRGYMVLSCVPN